MTLKEKYRGKKFHQLTLEEKGEVVQELFRLREKGLTNRELEKLLPLSRSYLRLIINGQAIPKLTKVAADRIRQVVYTNCLVCGKPLPCFECTKILRERRLKNRTPVIDPSSEETESVLSFSPEVQKKVKKVQNGEVPGTVPWNERTRRMRAGVFTGNPIPGVVRPIKVLAGSEQHVY